MLDTVEKKDKGTMPPRVGNTIDGNEDVSLALAKAIRDISNMLGNRASCSDIALAAAQCAVNILPGCSALIVEADNDMDSATILASSNAPYISSGDVLPAGPGSFLGGALSRPYKLCKGDSGAVDQLFPARAMYPVADDDVILCKAVVRKGATPWILAIIEGGDNEANAESVLLTLSELLMALCTGQDSARINEQNQVAIHRAKMEWERTVDTLHDLVCVVDATGRILRTNRTTERWNLGFVADVRGMQIHELLHPACDAQDCEIANAVSISAFSTAEDQRDAIVIPDQHLNRTLSIKTRVISQNRLPTDAEDDAFTVVVISDVTALHRAKEELKDLNESLEERVRVRTDELFSVNKDLQHEVTRRSKAEAELQASRDELASLSQQLINAQEDERSRLSRELHDSIGQSLGAIKYTLERVASAGDRLTVSEYAEVLESAIQGVTEAIKDTRAIAMRLRPPILDDMGAIAAIRWLINRFSETYTEMEFLLEFSVGPDEVPSTLTTPLYRIVQESLNNIAKHANANSALVSLRRESEKLILEIVDDGIGFDAAGKDTGQYRKLGNFGRLGMRERALNSNGVLIIDSTRGKGTKVQVEWEIDND